MISILAYSLGKLFLFAVFSQVIYKIATWRDEIYKPLETYEYILLKYK